MAHDPTEEGDKSPVENVADNEAATRAERGQPAHVEYDIERVEAVYRKLDRRIIPGKVINHP